jgi:serine/threonine protein phosphatase PrpC
VLLGCDGIYETKTNEQICKHLSKRMKQNPIVRLDILAEDLLDNLIALDTCEGFGCDNMSAIFVKFSN